MGFGKSSKSEGKKKKEGRFDGSGFTWFETSVNGGVHVLQILRQVAAKAPIPYLTQAAGAALVIIQIAQDVKDNKGDFRRLCQDAAALVAAVIESQQKSDDPARWPGAKLENVVRELVATLESIADFAEKQEKRKIVERVMNSTADGNKIREFRERLAQAMSRFVLSAHLQTYDILWTMEPMLKELVGKLDEDAKIEKQGREQEIIEAQRLEVKRWEQLRLADRQTQEREAAEQNERERKAAEKREREREAAEQREQEREAVKARVQTILQILEEEESRKQLSEERKKTAQEGGAAEDHRMGLGSSKRRQTEPVNDREFIFDSEDEEVEEKESRHYLVRQRKQNTQEVAVKAGRPELGPKNRRQTEPADKYREPVVEMESTEEEESRYEPVRERKKAPEGFAEARRTELGRKDRRQTEPASKNHKPRIESEDEEEETRQRPVKGRKKKAQEVAAKESRRVSKSRKHESEEEETEEESESGSSEEESIRKAAMAGVAAKLERRTKKKDELQSQMGRFQVGPPGFPWPQPQVMSPPNFGYQPWLNQPQFGGPPAGPNNWKLRNSKVSSSNDNNDYSTNYQSNNATHSNQENVGNDHSVTITKLKSSKRYK